MCGIAGAVWWEPSAAIDTATLERMTSVLSHRGPDDAGMFRRDFSSQPGGKRACGVALGHRRLSIIDLAGGHQPLANEDGSIQLIFNGEIYNYRELRSRLEAAGHVFRTSCDTEVIVHLYEDAGCDFLEQLNGMFALALWDANEQRLVLGRDRVGKKPLVYRLEPNRLLFASELKSLLEVPGVPREVDPKALDEYLTYQYVPHPRTIFRGISKLCPGQSGVWSDGRWTLHQYWHPDFNRERKASAKDYGTRLRELLTSSVALRLQSDVPLGAFLSGGIDSTIVVGLMQQLSSRPVKTFSIGFDVPPYDETRYARQVAERFGTDHHEFRVDPRGIELFDKLIWHYDEPFGDSSAIPTYYVSKLTREQVTVALTGDGGDELFAGYDRYAAVALAAWADYLPAVIRRLLGGRASRRLAAQGWQRSRLRRMARFAEVLSEQPAQRYLEWMSTFNTTRRDELYTDEFKSQLAGADSAGFLQDAFRRCAARDPVTQASLVDLMTYLPCDLLTKVDIAAMANSLECRQPFLDYRVVELAAEMPIRLKRRHGRGKWILRQAFADFLPREIGRRPKMGFGVPLEHWFRNEWKDFVAHVLLAPQADRGYFRPAAVRRLIDEHQSGRWNHSYRIWSLLVLELWHRRWIDATPARMDSPLRAKA